MVIDSAEELAWAIHLEPEASRRDKTARHEDVGRLWKDVQASLPKRHTLMVSGPRLDGTWWVGVIDTRRGSRAVMHDRGTLLEALGSILRQLDDYTPIELGETKPVIAAEAAPPKPNLALPKRDAKGRFIPSPAGQTKPEVPPSRIGNTNVTSDKAEGFTRNRDVVAYLIGKRQMVTQYELREVYGIKNPAQAINEFEEQYHVKLKTGKKSENGDIPYRLEAGKLPEIAGMLPLFIDGVEDPDDRLYVLELDLYMCKECRRRPVYKPTKTDDAYYGVCPRHGPQEFELY